MAEKKIKKVLLITENNGTAFWRVKNPLEFLRDIKACELCQLPIDKIPTRDRYWHEQWDIVVFHQTWQDQAVMLAQFLKSLGKKIILSIDDLINGYKIPTFVTGGEQYRENGIIHNIHDMMVVADKIVVTQPFLANELAHFFEIDIKRFYLLPNLPTYDWLGRYFNPRQKVERFKARNRKLRVGVISSLSHFKHGQQSQEEEGQEPVLPHNDDLELVEEALKEINGNLLNELTFVMPVGKDNEVTRRIGKLAKVEGHPMVPIRQYPTMINSLDLDLVVVPLQNTEFNHSKSNIKLIECAALGIPVLVSESFAYKGFIDEQFVFRDPKELGAKITWAMGWDEKFLMKTLTETYDRFFNKQSDYYGANINGYWLEQNIQLVGNTFLAFETDFAPQDVQANEDGIVEPKLKEVEDGKAEKQ